MTNKTNKSTKKLLFTPGPLTTSKTVKEAMLTDYGSRDAEFINMVNAVRSKLLKIGMVKEGGNYEAILMQGAGTFSIESVITTVMPKDGHILVIINGAYGERILKIVKKEGLKNSVLEYAENETPIVEEIEDYLKNTSSITHVAMVHCETTTGIINPIQEVGKILGRYNKTYIVDAMSSFGGVPIDIALCNIDFLVSSANKCIEGVPGFSFTIAKKDKLHQTQGNSKSISLDLYAQWLGLEKNGQFRFTPPTHVIAAFHQALLELDEEGGVLGRSKRYQENHKTLVEGMRRIGFEEYLAPEKQGYIITAFHYPKNSNFTFDKFYSLLNDKGFVIYPGKLSKVNCFRIGNIGRIFSDDIENLLNAIVETLKEINVRFASMSFEPPHISETSKT